MRKLVPIIAIVCLAGAAFGCRDNFAFGPEPPRGSEPIQTDRTQYRATWVRGEGTFAKYGFRLIATFRNLDDRTVYLSRCFADSPTPIYGVQLVSGEDPWGAAYSPTWGCVGHDRDFGIAPGATRSDTFRIDGPNAWDGRTGEPLGSLNGLFRLLYTADYCPDECPASVPASPLISNVFEVRVDR